MGKKVTRISDAISIHIIFLFEDKLTISSIYLQLLREKQLYCREMGLVIIDKFP